jgi:iron complex transport system substrate-binding protein
MRLLRRPPRRTLAGLLWLVALAAQALVVTDDRHTSVTLPHGPAQRIISLAPHITELLFAAGAGAHVVGTVAFSDYPAAARRLPKVGDVNALDLERIVALRPDLVIVWLQGSPQAQLDVLTALGVPIYYNEPRSLDDIGRSIERFGELAGTEDAARRAAAAYRARLGALRARYRGRAPVSFFLQVWDEPLMTVNDSSLISQALALCGGRNVFGGLRPLVPHVSIEAVLDADPEVIGTAAGGEGGSAADAGLGLWFGWPRLRAIARGNVYAVDPDLITRHTPRILDAAEQVCAVLDAARARRPASR